MHSDSDQFLLLFSNIHRGSTGERNKRPEGMRGELIIYPVNHKTNDFIRHHTVNDSELLTCKMIKELRIHKENKNWEVIGTEEQI